MVSIHLHPQNWWAVCVVTSHVNWSPFWVQYVDFVGRDRVCAVCCLFMMGRKYIFFNIILFLYFYLVKILHYNLSCCDMRLERFTICNPFLLIFLDSFKEIMLPFFHMTSFLLLCVGCHSAHLGKYYPVPATWIVYLVLRPVWHYFNIYDRHRQCF